MSVGTSVGEFLRLGKKAWDLYKACFDAPDVFKSAAQQCFSIHAAIEQTQHSLYELNSNYDHKNQDREVYVKLSLMTANCRHTLLRLEQILASYKKLGTSGHNIWDTARFALGGVKKDLAEIRSELGSHLAAISLFLQNVHYERIEGALGKLQRAQSASKAAPSGSDKTQLPGFALSLERALRTKRLKLLAETGSDQDWHARILPLTAAEQSKHPTIDPDTPYTQREQWLSTLPEGWQKVWINAIEYQYRYVLRPKSHVSSRPYNGLVPFDTFIEVELDDLLPGWQESTKTNGSTHYYEPSSGRSQLQKPSMRIQDLSDKHVVGWQCHDGLPIDMTDDISLELASARYLEPRIPIDDIDAPLPKGWRWSYDADDHPIYTSTSNAPGSREWQSSVHPAFFTSDRGRLPPGWDRRLDSWGSLFYVDHHTATAQRAHPRDDGTTDVVTGLPKGWTSVIDHNHANYYVEETALLATYNGNAIKSGSEEFLITLSRRPMDGEIPPKIHIAPTGGRETYPMGQVLDRMDIK